MWAVGDCNGRGAFTHTAWNDHEIVVTNCSTTTRDASATVSPFTRCSSTPRSVIGITETEARASGRKVLRAKIRMQLVGRAREAGETQGFMKVLVDAETLLLLCAALLGLNGDEVVHGVLDVMAAKLPYTVASRAMHIHPTVSELVPTLLQQLKPLA